MPSSPAIPRRSAAIAAETTFGKIDPIQFGFVEYPSLDQLSVMPGNPRVHSSENIDAIARAICATRVMPPMIVTDDNKVVAGEGRLAAARLMKLSTVPILRASNLTEDQIEAFRIADNRVAELSKFDDQRLAVALKNMSSRDLSFNIEHIGFKQADIDIRIGSLDDVIDPQNDSADLSPEPPTAPTTRLGEVSAQRARPASLVCPPPRRRPAPAA